MKISFRTLAIIALLGGLTVAAQAQVIGSWQGSGDGWIDWGTGLLITDPANPPGKYQFVSGVVPGYGQSLQLSQSGWNQGLAIKLENIPGGKAAFLKNHLLSITWSVPAGTGGGYEQLALNINAQGYGFNLQPGSVMSITGSGSINGNNAELDFYAGSPAQTQTVTWDYSSILPAITAGGTGWIELIFTSNSGGGAPGTFYFNNAVLGLGTAFTYQGRLNANGSPANSLYDIRFAIYDEAANGNVVSGVLTNAATPVTNGLFTVTLDFGSGVFTGNPRWLELGVRPNGGGDFTTLAPRQPLTPTPYAIFANTANTANTASNVSGTISASQLTGTIPASQLSGTVGNGQLASSSITVNAGTGLSGGGAVLLGGSTTLNNAGVLSLTGNGDITVSAASGAVTLGDTASSANTANTIVKRDGSGNFAAGAITAGSFTGNGSGLTNLNLTGPSANNTAVGVSALHANTNGSYNTANGYQAQESVGGSQVLSSPHTSLPSRLRC